MEIEVGDSIFTSESCYWVVTAVSDTEVTMTLLRSSFTHKVQKRNILHLVYVAKQWAIKKKVTVLNKEALEDL